MEKGKQNTAINLIICSLILFSFSNSIAQKLDSLNTESYKTAVKYFDKKQYDKSIETFSHLLSLQPENAQLNYYYGVCLIETNKHIKLAQNFLKYALKSNVPENVYYYLAKSYHITYHFDKAIIYYSKFLTKAKRKEIRKFETERQIEMCENGKELIKTMNKLDIIKNISINSLNFFRAYDINLDGKITIKPKELYTIKEKLQISPTKQNIEKIVFYSDESEYIYYSKKSYNNKLDIVVKQKLNSNKWSKAKKLSEVINTRYDDAFPFLNSDGKTLYFSSKGHNSIGGYDIFKSTFDSVRNCWTKPVNMNFPINTPYDDVLYVLDENENYATFASNRMSDNSKISVFTIKINEKSDTIILNDIEEIIYESSIPFGLNYEQIDSIAEDKSFVINDFQSQRNLDTIRFLIQKFNKYHDYYKIKENELKNIINKRSLLENENSKTEGADSNLKFIVDRSNILSKAILKNIIKLNEIEICISESKVDKKCMSFVEKSSKLSIFLKNLNNEVENDYQTFVKQLLDEMTKQKPVVNETTIEKDENMYFMSFDKNGNLIHDKKTKVETDLDCFFVVQLGVFIKDIKKDVLRNIMPVIVENLEHSQKRYSTGIFSDYKTAETKRKEIVKMGIEDAYVKAFLYGKATTIENAINFLNSNEIDTFADNKFDEEQIENNIEINDSIVYKIQIGVYSKNFDIEGYKKQFKEKQEYRICYLKNEEKIYVFLCNGFNNYKDAVKFKKEVRNKGIYDAFIVVFHGDRLISLDEANKLKEAKKKENEDERKNN